MHTTHIIRTLLIVIVSLIPCSAFAANLPPPRVPDCLGVNIHFDNPQPGEFEMLVAAGFKIIRTDIIWNQAERRRGEYDFSRWDKLFALYEKHHLRALCPLLYTNPLYDDNLSPHSDQAVAAFASFAAAAVRHFKGRGVIWEIYNEPNNVFWKPMPDVNGYIKLAQATAKAIKNVSPDEIVVGPALSGTDGAWLEPCYKAGLLELWDAVTVHPYGNEPPEMREIHYRGVRALIDRYQPKGKIVPFLSGEWGYTSANMSPELQGKLLARQFLFNLSHRLPVSIWYDWRDDGNDPANAEHNFGVVANGYRENETPPLKPKPAYHAMKTLTTQLDGYTFATRISLASPDDWLLVFTNGDSIRAAAWTTAAKSHVADLPAAPGQFTVTAFDGAPLPPASAADNVLKLELTDGPKYLIPAMPDPIWRKAVRF